MVSQNQSAFVKKRCIHDNYIYVQGLIKEIKHRGQPALFIKLDIAKAFDSVLWSYLFELLERLGFGPRWREWIAIMLAHQTSRVLLNGKQGRPIKHLQGLRQGDPLSLMLFILGFDPLQRLIIKAIQNQILAAITARKVQATISMYGDDTAIFIAPRPEELKVLDEILQHFGEATGMSVNLEKTEVYPINCRDIDMQDVLQDFPATIKQLPCTYLGLPLHCSRLRKIDYLPLIDKVAGKLPSWKGKHIAKVGRLRLVSQY